MSRPTVSVVFAAYNASWCIGRAIDSLLAQTVVPDEILVCDDGSTDGTPEFVEGRYGDRVRVLRLPHRNAAAARRDGLSVARGQWLAFVDADDWWEPTKLERQLDFLVRHPQVRWLSSDGDYVSAEGVVAPSWLADYFQPPREMVGDLFAPLLQRCFPLMSSMLVEREAYHSCGGIDPFLVYSHDYDLWLRLAARFPGGVQNEKLVHYWLHAGALSRNFDARHRDDWKLMVRIATGELRAEPELRRAAADRAAGLAFKVAITALKNGQQADTQRWLRRATRGGPWSRRLLAFACGFVPGGWFGPIARLPWVKRAVLRMKPGTPSLGGGA
ncbi:MAG: glycosyltransferase family 2 protein [Candidatus Eisenbacteria bacterium]